MNVRLAFIKIKSNNIQDRQKSRMIKFRRSIGYKFNPDFFFRVVKVIGGDPVGF